jgi:hypothetical protein
VVQKLTAGQIRPFRRFPMQCSVTYNAGPFQGHGTIWNLLRGAQHLEQGSVFLVWMAENSGSMRSLFVMLLYAAVVTMGYLLWLLS